MVRAYLDLMIRHLAYCKLTNLSYIIVNANEILSNGDFIGI